MSSIHNTIADVDHNMCVENKERKIDQSIRDERTLSSVSAFINSRPSVCMRVCVREELPSPRALWLRSFCTGC